MKISSRFITFLGLFITAAAFGQQIKVNQLPSVSSVSGSDLTIDDQSGTTKVATFTQVLSFLQSNISVQCASLPPLNGLISSSGCTTFYSGIVPITNGGTGASSLAAASIPIFSGSITTGHCVTWASPISIADAGFACGSGGGSSAFSALTGSTNTSAVMIVGTGASLSASGSGTISATQAPLSGITGLGTGVGTFLATPSSANLAAAVTGETGTGALVFGTSPTLVTPNLDTPSAVNLTNGTALPFNGVTNGTTSGTLLVGTGGSLGPSGSGTVTATSLTALSGLPSIATQTVLGNGSGSSAPPVALALGANLIATATGIGTSQVENKQTTTSYTICAVAPCSSGNYFPSTGSPTDSGALVSSNNGSAVAWALPQAGTTGFGAGFSFDAWNIGTGNVTITPTTSTINGSATLVLLQYQGCQITSDGTNYVVSYCSPLANAASGNWAVNGNLFAQNVIFAKSFIESQGTVYTIASGTGGCASTTAKHGGAIAGDFTCTGTAGASTVTLTLAAVTTGYTCNARDVTTSANVVNQTGAISTTSVTFSMTTGTTSEVIQFGCPIAY